MSLELPSQALHSHCSEQWEAGEAEEQNRQQEQEPTVVGEAKPEAGAAEFGQRQH